MKRLLPFAILLFALLLAALGVLFLRGGGDAPQPPQGAPTLTGRLIDDAQNPVHGAFVFVGDAATRTLADGTFHFYNVPPGEHEVDASADGYIRPGSGPLGRTRVTIDDAQPSDPLQLTLYRAAALSGEVVAGDEPLYGASISLSYINAHGLIAQELEPFILSQVGTTDAGGRFAIEPVAPGRLQILVETPDHPFAESHEILLHPGQKITTLRIDVAPAGGVRGSIVNEEGEPLVARLTLTSKKNGRTRTALSDEQGRYQFRTLAAGDYRLRVQADGYQEELIQSLFVESDELSDRDIVLTPHMPLMGRALEPDGTPVPGAYIRLNYQGQTQHLVADEDGNFSFDAEPGTSGQAQAFSPHHDPSPLTPLIPGQKSTLQLTPGGHIFGEVVDAQGRIVTGYQISAASLETTNPYLSSNQFPALAPQDERGRFEFGPLPSGRVRLRVSSPDHPIKLTDSIVTRAGQRTGPIRIQLDEGADLEGFVLDIESGEPIKDAQVFHAARGEQRPSATTDADGRFLITSLPSGLQSFQIAHQDYFAEIFSGISIPQQGSITLEFELMPTQDSPGGYTFHGIGAALRRDDDYIEITSLEEDSPGLIAGLKVGDRVRAVDGERTLNLTLDQVIERIRGEDGEAVTLQIERPGAGRMEYTIPRERVIIHRRAH